MKKEYSAPVVEKIAFDYRNQVVAASSVVDTPTTPPDNGGSGTDNYGWDDLITDLLTTNFFQLCSR